MRKTTETYWEKGDRDRRLVASSDQDRYLFATRDATFVKNCYDATPWRTSVNGHLTIIVPAVAGDPGVECVRNPSTWPIPGSAHTVTVPIHWRHSVWEVGGPYGYLSGRWRSFVLSAECLGVQVKPKVAPYYRLKVVCRDRGTLVRSVERFAQVGNPDQKVPERYWYLCYPHRAETFKEMPAPIVADYLQDHDHLLWTDERVAHLRAQEGL